MVRDLTEHAGDLGEAGAAEVARAAREEAKQLAQESGAGWRRTLVRLVLDQDWSREPELCEALWQVDPKMAAAKEPRDIGIALRIDGALASQLSHYAQTCGDTATPTSIAVAATLRERVKAMSSTRPGESRDLTPEQTREALAAVEKLLLQGLASRDPRTMAAALTVTWPQLRANASDPRLSAATREAALEAFRPAVGRALACADPPVRRLGYDVFCHAPDLVPLTRETATVFVPAAVVTFTDPQWDDAGVVFGALQDRIGAERKAAGAWAKVVEALTRGIEARVAAGELQARAVGVRLKQLSKLSEYLAAAASQAPR